jgi:hypothetical protein
VHRELHRREIRSDAAGNFMQNDNTGGRPVGTVSFNDVTEGTTTGDADDVDVLLLCRLLYYFPVPSDMFTSPKRFPVRRLSLTMP